VNCVSVTVSFIIYIAVTLTAGDNATACSKYLCLCYAFGTALIGIKTRGIVRAIVKYGIWVIFFNILINSC